MSTRDLRVPLTNFQTHLQAHKLLIEDSERHLSEREWLALREILIIRLAVPDDAPALAFVCPDCKAERADYEGPNGQWLHLCPSCSSTADPIPAAGEPLASRKAPSPTPR